MDRRKTTRDALIIVVIIVAGLVIFRSRAPGPVERAQMSRDAQTAMSADGSNMDMATMDEVHGNLGHGISDGEPLVSLGDRSIGSEWFDHMVASAIPGLIAVDYEETEAYELAEFATLLEGFRELIQGQAAEELGIQPDAEAVAEREEHFFSSFATEDEAMQVLEAHDLSMDRLRALWERESVRFKLMSAVTEALGLDPDAEEAEVAYNEWVMEQIFTSDLVFHDPDLEAFFEAEMHEISSGAGLEEDSEREADSVEDVAAVNGSPDNNSDGAESSGTD